jgi:hypothetical protein
MHRLFPILIWISIALMAVECARAAAPADAPSVVSEAKPEGVSSLEKMLVAAMERFGTASTFASLPKDLVDCRGFAPGVLSDFSNRTDPFNEWLFDGPYSWTYWHFPNGTCVLVGGRDGGRGLLADEARAFLKAAHAGIDDPAHPGAQQWQNCMARAMQEHGSNIPDYESGTINGRRYRVFYAALDPDLKRLDDVQHAHVAAEKERWKRMPELAKHVGDASFDIEIRIRTTGRTKQLATLEADESTPGDKDITHIRQTSWMLHIPSGRLLTFEDLFTDPKAVHERIVTGYLDRLPEQLDRMMESIMFFGEDGKEKKQEYRDRYLSDAHKFATTPTEHFLNVQLSATGERPLVIIGDFSKERLLDSLSASWHVMGTDLQSYLKPEFRLVFENEICPAPLASPH